MINQVRFWLVFSLAFVSICSALLLPAVRPASVHNMLTVVLDPGHGGMDSGVLGRTTRAKESDTNLAVAEKLKRALERQGVRVYLTRSDTGGLYDEDCAGNKKKQDMQRRMDCIRDRGADLFISVHMNAFPDTVSRGGQVFYQSASEESHCLATTIQQGFGAMDPSNDRVEKVGDYYVLNHAPVPAVLVECGFFSHPEEEKMLLTEEYQQQVAEMIARCVLAYHEKRTA